MFLHLERRCPLHLQLLRMLRLVVLQVHLSCLLGGAEDAEVALAECFLALSLVPALVWIHSLEASLVSVRLNEKVLLYRKQHRTCRLLLQLLQMLRLVVLQVRLSCLLGGAEVAEVAFAECFLALSLVPAMV